MSSERVHVTPINCRIKEYLLATRPNPLERWDIVDVLCNKGVEEAKPEIISGFVEPLMKKFQCFENCPHKIPDSERFKGIGTFTEWPENSHFFGG